VKKGYKIGSTKGLYIGLVKWPVNKI